MLRNKESNVISSEVSCGIISPDKTIDKKAGGVVLDLVFKVTDKDGKITKEHKEEGHSFLANFIKLLYCSAMLHHAPMSDGVALVLVDTTGTNRSGSSDYAITGGLGSAWLRANASIGVNDWGIMVGTDDGTILPKDINNYALGAKIAHGTGSGQISYGDSSIVPVVHDGASYSYAGITRSFSNSSGSGINVNEIGLATNIKWDAFDLRNFLFTRDILGSPITVPNGQALTASINIKCYC